MTINKLNKKLEKHNLELIKDKYSKKINCFCTTMTQTPEQLEAMRMIRQELRISQKLVDIIWLSYFK